MKQQYPTSARHHDQDGRLRGTEPWISEFERIFVASATGIRGEEMAALRRVNYKRSRQART